MKFKDFLKDKIWSLMLMIFSVITVAILVVFYNISIYIKIYIIVTPIVAYTIGILIELQSNFSTKRAVLFEVEE